MTLPVNRVPVCGRLSISALRRAALLLVAPALLAAQEPFTAAEFAGRRVRIYEAIGPTGVAIVVGAPMVGGFNVFRQNNEFYYLTGITRPGAYVVLDGATKTTTLYLPPRNANLERAEGKMLSAEDADSIRGFTGIETTVPVDSMTARLTRLGRGRIFYTPASPGENRYESRGERNQANRLIQNDPWDGEYSREFRFATMLRARTTSDVRDLTPLMDPLRGVKSPAEVVQLRRAGQLSALGIRAAMQTAAPGVYEYQLDAAARYQYFVNGAMGEGYRPITASGANHSVMHYYANNNVLDDGEFVLMDAAPEVNYYTSDIGRMFPVNGKYSAEMRELYGFVVEYQKAVLRSIKVGLTRAEVLAAAQKEIEPVMAKWKFSSARHEAAAKTLITTGGGVLSHGVGMAVHDDGGWGNPVIQSGNVFSVDPQMRIVEEGLYIRIEDTIVVTEAGVENLTGLAPTELDDVEKLMKEKGLTELFPPSAPARGTPAPPPIRS